LWYSDKLRDSCEQNIKSGKTAYIILNTVDLGPDVSIWHVPPKRALEERPIPSNYISVHIHGGHKSITSVDRDEFVIGRIDHVLPTYLLKIACGGGHSLSP